MWTRAMLKGNAKAAIKNNYANSVIAALVLAFVSGALGSSTAGNRSADSFASGRLGGDLSSLVTMLLGIIIVIGVIGLIIRILILNPLLVGAQKFFIENHYSASKLSPLLWAFKSNYINIVKTMFLTDIYTFLWSLLFVIPGIVKSYSYRMVPYILADNPNADSSFVITLSRNMMNGEKLNAFILDLSFIPWSLLAVVTFNIAGIFYVYPYIYETNAELYISLKGDSPYINSGFFNKNGFNNGGYYE